MVNHKYKFWEQQIPNETGMLLTQVSDLSSLERSEIIAQLPSIIGKQVLELGAGIGRYTKTLIKDANQVIAIDFIKKFLHKNRQLTQNYNNVSHICASAQSLNFKPERFDIVFTNWLFMYLEDSEVNKLIQHIHLWLKTSGIFFIRESCKIPSNNNPEFKYFTYYRDPEYYIDLLKNYFRIRRSGNVTIYHKLFNNPYQLFWLCEKY
ncbi:MAG: methyltransferase domain-containing protein [Promethearchaeota archaeon]